MYKVVKWLAIGSVLLFSCVFFAVSFVALAAVMDTELRRALMRVGLGRSAQSIVLFILAASWIGLVRSRRSAGQWYIPPAIFLFAISVDVFAHSWGVKQNLF